jgi:hypothetical protein
MTILRTPDERFENLPGYDFAPHYVEVKGMRVHYEEKGEEIARHIFSNSNYKTIIVGAPKGETARRKEHQLRPTPSRTAPPLP